MFDVIPHDRHTASGDAFITAQVLLRLLKLASRCGRTTLGRIGEEFVVHKIGGRMFPSVPLRPFA